MTHTNNEKAPGLQSEGLNTDTANDLDFATGKRQRKAISTAVATLALHGHAVHVGNGDYLVSRWGMSRYCQNLEALQDFARMVGAAP